MNDSEKWFFSALKDESILAVAEKIGVQQATLNRQIRGNRLSPENVVKIADAYGVDAIDGLIAIGLITEDHAQAHITLASLRAATDKEIAEEIWRRLVTDG
jgi:transcriptional regulator with XRE-family HTH domain